MVDMIQPSNSVNNTIPITQEVDADIQEALALIAEVKAQDSKTTVKELENLLIEYIIANMKGDSAGAEAIQGQIATLMQKYGNDIRQGNELVAKVKAMVDSHSSKDLTYLQSLITALKQDVDSGDMSNLYSFNSQSNQSA